MPKHYLSVRHNCSTANHHQLSKGTIMSGIFPSSGVPAGSALNTVDVATTGCASGGGELFHSTSRCTPRFDPASANAVISEMLNLVACAGKTYDCSRLNNLCTAVTDLILDTIFDCLPRDFPQAGQACSIEQLVWVTDKNGCSRIARYTAANTSIANETSCSVSSVGGATSAPANPANPATYYDYTALNNAFLLSSINEALLKNTIIVDATFNLDCTTVLDFDLSGSVPFAPSADGGAGRVSRIIGRIDNTFFITSTGDLATLGRFTNFEASYTATPRRSLPAGVHRVRFYAVQDNVAYNMAAFNTLCNSTGGGSANLNIRPAA
jgi:hypothetical protein